MKLIHFHIDETQNNALSNFYRVIRHGGLIKSERLLSKDDKEILKELKVSLNEIPFEEYEKSKRKRLKKFKNSDKLE